MEELHKQSVEAFIEKVCKEKEPPAFDELAYRLWFNIGWPIETMRHVFLTLNRAYGRRVYRYHADNEKIKRAAYNYRPKNN